MKGSNLFPKSGACHLVTIHPLICAHLQTHLHRYRFPGRHGATSYRCRCAVIRRQGYWCAIAALAVSKGQQTT